MASRAELASRITRASSARTAHGPDATFWEADPATLRFTFVSRNAGRLLGYPLRRWTDESDFWARHLHHEDSPRVVAQRRSAIHERREHTLEYRMMHADGSVVWLRDAVTLVEYAGRVRAVHGVIVDVTAVKRAEEALSRHQRMFETITRSLPDPVVMLDANQQIVSCNPAAEHTFARSSEKLTGSVAASLFASWDEFERASDARSERGHDPSSALTARLRRANGEEFGAEIRRTIVEDDEGRPVGFVDSIREVSQRDRAARNVHQSERRFRDFAATASDWFWEMDEGLRFSYFSERFTEVTGVHVSELLGRTRQETGIPNVDPQRWEEHLQNLSEHRAFRGFVHPRTKNDGSLVWLSISGRPVFDDDGRFVGYRGTGSDITEQVQSESKLRESEERFRQFAEMAADWFWETDADLRYTLISGRYEQVTGADPQRLIGRNRLDHILRWLPNDGSREDHARLVLAREPFDDLECRVVRDDGDPQLIQSSGQPRYDQRGRFLGYRGVARDVTEERRMAAQLEHQASHDPLTGLVNRRAFEERLGAAIRRAIADGSQNALCYLDLDQFKVINDTCGHVAGDELLRQLATVLRTKVRAHDTLARLGGDEFGILLDHCSLDDAERIADGIRAAVADFRFAWDSKYFTIGVSIGVVPVRRESGALVTVLSAADAACYLAKDNGRNRVHIASHDDAELTQRRGEMQWVARLNRAMDEDRFELWSQRIIGISPLHHAGEHYEILLRMIDDEGRRVPPGAFLPAAERYGLASRLDRWVVTRTLDTLASSRRHLRGLELCSINLSGNSITEPGFLEFLARAVRDSEVPAERICFEITETAAVGNLSAAHEFIEQLKALGCRFALDDFGSGLSSFAYLKALDVDFLKIDGQFVKDIGTDPIDRAMVRSIHEVAEVMGKQTIAEFVEDDEILEALRTIGVDYAQGYGIGRPRPLREQLAEDASPRQSLHASLEEVNAVGSPTH